MMYSTTCSYAIRALARLAVIRPDGYVRIQELCENTDLPSHFLAKIFRDLVAAGLLTSAKGRGGGFALASPPNQITLYDIVGHVDGVESLDACVVGMASCSDTQPCPQHDQWKPIRNELKKFLLSTTLDMMADTLNKKMDILGEPVPVLQSKSKPLARG